MVKTEEEVEECLSITKVLGDTPQGTGGFGGGSEGSYGSHLSGRIFCQKLVTFWLSLRHYCEHF